MGAALTAPPAAELLARLAEPFDPAEVRFKPGQVRGNRALALAYVDARAIQDRLDAVLGVDGWQDDYEVLACGSVVCRLRLRVGGAWVVRTDVGAPSEQPDAGDRLKAAFSDALKRAAVKFGVGRYLYRLPAHWVDYDREKKHFTGRPVLPAWAVPVLPAVMVTALEKALAETHKTAAGALTWLGLPADTPFSRLTRGQADRLLAALTRTEKRCVPRGGPQSTPNAA
jgi:hypothetical protein